MLGILFIYILQLLITIMVLLINFKLLQKLRIHILNIGAQKVLMNFY
nr:MAG TPA: hypothetical protein [Bacteriophage sp.]